MRFARGVWLTLLLLMISAAVAQAQQSSKISTVNYGNIVITATNWPFLIAEQEGMFQKESFDFKRVIGGNTTATAQALVAGSTEYAQMNLVVAGALINQPSDFIALASGLVPSDYRLITWTTFSTPSPARIFGLHPKKGAIMQGADADLIVIDLKRPAKITREMLHTVTPWSIYEGWGVTGWPVMTIVRGNVVMEWPENESRAKVTDASVGQYLRRQLARSV
jgi:hypothetical protein